MSTEQSNAVAELTEGAGALIGGAALAQSEEDSDRRHRVWKYPLKLWDRIHSRPFTFIGIVLAIVACTRPQVFHIVIDLPWSGRFPSGILRAIAFVAGAAWLVGGAICGMVLVVPEDGRRSEAEIAKMPGLWRWIARLGIWMTGGRGDPAARPARRLDRLKAWLRSGRFLAELANVYPAADAALVRDTDRRRRDVVSTVFFVAALLWMIVPTVRAAEGGGMAEFQRRLLLGLALLASWMWFLVGPMTPGPASLSRRTAGRYIFMITFGLIWGEITWALPELPTSSLLGCRLSFRFYTIWAVLFLLFIIVATGRMADLVRTKTKLALVVLGLVVSQIDSGFVVDTHAITEPARVKQAFAEETEEWFARLEQRILRGRADRPIVIVAASGGGSRAAMFAGLVYEYLAHNGFDGAKVERPEDAIGHNIAMVSSVSGGSLASAYYLARSSEPERDEPRNFIPDEVASNLAGVVGEWVKVVDDCKKNPDSCFSLEEAGVRRRRDDAFPRVLASVKSLPKEGPAVAPWLFRSALVDDMATDFMAPLLRGVLTPFLERGHSVSSFWSERFGWSKIRQHSCPEGAGRTDGRWLCDWSSRRPPPLALLNATNVKTGRRVVVGYPPLPVGLLGEEMTSLSDYGGAFDLTLADGARLSANFPWGFEIGLFDTKYDTMLVSPQSLSKRLKLTDGGVTDNSGIDTIATLFEHLEVASRPPKADDVKATTAQTRDEFLARRARAIRDLLLTRGLMLVEIDAGARPSTAGVVGRLFPVVTDPLDALSLGGWGGATTMKKGLISRVEQAFQKMTAQENRSPGAGREGGAGQARSFQRLTFVCNHTEGVMTAWALGPKDKATIMASFLVEADATEGDLKAKGASLQQLANDIQREKAAASREAAKADGSGSKTAASKMAENVVGDRRKVDDEQRQEENEELSSTRARGEPIANNRLPLVRPAAPAVTASSPGLAARRRPAELHAVIAAETAPVRPQRAAGSYDRHGWVYLGHYDGGEKRWLTVYFESPAAAALPDPLQQLVGGQQLTTNGRVNVREQLPDAEATFAAVKAVLRPGAKVRLANTPQTWQQTGYIWAEVDY